MKRVSTSKRIKKIATIIVVGGMALIFLFDIAVNIWAGHLEKRFPLLPASFDFIGDGGNRIHFLNTGNSDCVLLESRGRFALVDSGWGSENPIEASRRPGYEQRVLDYLGRVASDAASVDATGQVTLDFILPTHYHYDHAGGFPAILEDPAITVKEVFLRPLDQTHRRYFERNWDIPVIRQRIEDAAAARGFPIAEELPDKPFQLGDMTVQFFNLDSCENPRLKGENDNSVVTLISLPTGRTALLTGDISASTGLERQIARQLKETQGDDFTLDLLKIPHHGYTMSSSAAFLRALRPKLAVATNDLGKIYPNVKWNLALVSCTTTISSAHENGVIVTFAADGNISLRNELHLEN